jgi:hypothetical protein
MAEVQVRSNPSIFPPENSVKEFAPSSKSHSAIWQRLFMLIPILTIEEFFAEMEAAAGADRRQVTADNIRPENL